jgi:hypothetical protein
MAWERSFEARIMQVRAKELKYQRLHYIIQVELSLDLSAALLTFYKTLLSSFW